MGQRFSDTVNKDWSEDCYQSFTTLTLRRAIARAETVLKRQQTETASPGDGQLYSVNALVYLRINAREFWEIFSDYSYLLVPGQYLALPIQTFHKFDPDDSGTVRAIDVIAAIALFCQGHLRERIRLLIGCVRKHATTAGQLHDPLDSEYERYTMTTVCFCAVVILICHARRL